ncbi:MAG: PEP/pyruvate-binding domain-containing protein [Kiritimatiellales bacterium]
MKPFSTTLSTGIPDLDHTIRGVLAGDNIVWQVDDIAEYQAFVLPFAQAAQDNGRVLIYFRFARHEPLLPSFMATEVHELDPQIGFEGFIADIHDVIRRVGKGAFYVFDCLSCLAVDWYSDQMLGNFFMLTCPYLFDLETVTYFALFRNYHTQHAIGPISRTTQLFLDVYSHKGHLYLRPMKTQHRHSPTINMLHEWRKEDDTFHAVSSSNVISEILTSARWSGLSADSSGDFWETTFVRAREMIKSGTYRPDIPERGKILYEQLSRMIISRDEAMQRLIARNLTLEDILDVRKRMIGTGLIGGKTVGMLLARAILKRADPRYVNLLEEHDSFYIGSDAFYTFLVRNGIWKVRQNQRDPERFLEGAEEARHMIIRGDFPDYILQQFDEMLDYFGPSPFIVRSSSLLEDNYGNSYAGKYDSVFCANQGPRERRLQDLLAAVKTIYASSMSERALNYRARRGALDKDEQMALLVMRVSGASYGHYFYPQAAGVAFSFNPYAWSPDIDPEAGVMRLVFGLGTRAVDRSDDDHTRIVALNAPDKRPEGNFEATLQYTQRRVDCLDLESNQPVSELFNDLIKTPPEDLPLDMFAAADLINLPDGRRVERRMLTFDKLLKETPFVNDMRDILNILHEAYDYPVDIEFTMNFVDEKNYRINLVQCRPLQVQGVGAVKLPEIKVPEASRIIEARGAVVGQSRLIPVDRLIYVIPALYGKLPLQERYAVSRLIGEINRTASANSTVMLLGPGRWGTSSPELGIPVSFNDINHVNVLCEIVAMHENLVPDVSLGTHFLNELVENNMLYLALFPKQGSNFLNEEFFLKGRNRLLDLVPSAEKWADAVHVIEASDLSDGSGINLWASAVDQKVVCYLK